MLIKRAPTRLLKTGLNAARAQTASTMISAGKIDKTTEWTAKDVESKTNTDLCIGESADFIGYSVGKEGKVYRSALLSVRAKAAANGDDVIFKRAGVMLDELDGTKTYSGQKSLPMKMKAWAKLEYKGMTETDTHYVMSGLASTPNPDRMDDIVEPLGAEYELPLPLLWQHDSDQPIGEVFEAKPNKNGIPVQFRIPKLDTPGTLKDRLDEAVQSIKMKLVSGLSIGFSPIEYSFMDNGGVHFLKWAWLELSTVTIPANIDATIKGIRAADETAVKKKAHRVVKIGKAAPAASREKSVFEGAAELRVRNANAMLFTEDLDS